MASSGMRSRIDWAMVLPVRIRMVKNTATRMRVTSAPMSPICLAKPMANSFSGWVLVSSGEFMKSVSIAAEIALRLGGVGDALDVPAGLAAPELARLVEVGDVDQHHVGVAAHGRILGVDDADQVELPVQVAVLAWRGSPS